jgi:hypothetical protein
MNFQMNFNQLNVTLLLYYYVLITIPANFIIILLNYIF